MSSIFSSFKAKYMYNIWQHIRVLCFCLVFNLSTGTGTISNLSLVERRNNLNLCTLVVENSKRITPFLSVFSYLPLYVTNSLMRNVIIVHKKFRIDYFILKRFQTGRRQFLISLFIQVFDDDMDEKCKHIIILTIM